MNAHTKETKPRAVWTQLEPENVLEAVGSGWQGLTSLEAQARLEKQGANEIRAKKGSGLRGILFEQVSSTMILILFVAGVLALFFKSSGGVPVDALAIFAMIAIFVALGTVQEFRAQKAIEALGRMAAPNAQVFRDEVVVSLPARALVPGDVVKLEAGQSVPADGRLLVSHDLRVQEASLTGESQPAEKVARALSGAVQGIGDRINMVHMGSLVTHGRATVVVVATGMETELGRIATMIGNVKKERTPLQKKLDALGRTLAWIALFVAALVALIGIFVEGKSLASVIVMSISIAVAIVPEGLPAVLTFTLAVGAKRMLGKKALVRKLPAVETLGSVTTICSDKTGTLTQNEMTMVKLATSPYGSCEHPSSCAVVPSAALSAFSLCTDVTQTNENAGWTGDPTEIALVHAAKEHGASKSTLDSLFPRLAECPFDSDRKLMSTVHARGPETPLSEWSAFNATEEHEAIVITKGAIEQILSRCTHMSVVRDGIHATAELDANERSAILTLASTWASRGERVLGVACRALAVNPREANLGELEQKLTFLGLCSLVDPPRPEAREAIAKCRTAGIRVVMITGDHPATAKAIATDLGLCDQSDAVVSGTDLQRLGGPGLEELVTRTRVFARVSPEQKLLIVTALQARGHVVAMTGDGVNDAPALRKADIGVAMGTGTDVAKEAADIVLLDDNFATIVSAVEEGRIVFDNLRRFLMFSLSGNVAKVMLVTLSPLAGMKAVLTPIQVLFSNLLTDGLLGLGMGLEKAEPDTMQRPPYPPTESLFSRGAGLHVAVVGPVLGVALLTLAYVLWPGENATPQDIFLWGTTLFTALAFTQLARALSARSFRVSALRTGFSGNPLLLAMILVALGLQVTVVVLEPLNLFFNTVALPAASFLTAASAALVLFIVMEVVKKLLSQGTRQTQQFQS
ncbi:MAG: cation-transporting P-type ATPase [Silvanigrellales bacterium]|nr:cation-transporting P-type ATPase [Silvanigrellales bacterium]